MVLRVMKIPLFKMDALRSDEFDILAKVILLPELQFPLGIGENPDTNLGQIPDTMKAKSVWPAPPKKKRRKRRLELLGFVRKADTDIIWFPDPPPLPAVFLN